MQGEWNGILEFSYTSGETRVVDVTKLPVTRKLVRPIDKQGPTESRSEDVDLHMHFFFNFLCLGLSYLYVFIGQTF